MAHPFQEHRQHKVEKSRVGHIAHGYARGGAVHHGAPSSGTASKRATAERDAQAVEGSRPNRARGGRVKKPSTSVNIMIAPQAGFGATSPPAGSAGPVGAAPQPIPAPRPAVPPPPMPPGGMPMRARGGRVSSGPAWESGLKAGTPVQHSDGKNDAKDVGRRGKPVTYKTGGAVFSAAKGQMGPKFDGGAGGGTARIQKEERAERKYARAK